MGNDEEDARDGAEVSADLPPPGAAGGQVAALLSASQVDENTLARLLGPGGTELLRGLRLPTQDEAGVLAAYLDAPVGVLLGEEPTTVEASLRLGTIDDVEDVVSTVEHGTRLLEAERVTRGWGLQRPPVLLDELPRSHDGHFVTAGKTTAVRLRGYLGLGPQQPVEDVTNLVESLGHPAEHRPMSKGVHGLSLRERRPDGVSWIVLVNSRDWWGRQRYTTAHELCHVLYNDPGQVIVERVDPGQRHAELRAESFARHLLLPSAGVRAVCRAEQPADVTTAARVIANVALTFGASVAASLNAVDELIQPHLIQGCRDMPKRQLMELAGRADEWDELVELYARPAPSARLTEQVLEAFARQLVGIRTVADVLDGGDEQATRARLAGEGWDDLLTAF